MVKDHSDGLLISISKKKVLLYAPNRITHTTAFVTPVVEYWLDREIAHWVHHEESIRRPIAPRANALTTDLYLAHIRIDQIKENVIFTFVWRRTE